MNQYAKLTGDELNEHLSNFLVEHLSYSSIRSFQRNELAYERRYIFKIYDASGASALAGSAYHFALEQYFRAMMQKRELPGLAELSNAGFGLIDSKNAKEIKRGKKHGSADEVKAEASEKFRKLILNFLAEANTYLDDIAEVLFVEERFTTFLQLSGWDCPLPFVFVADLIYRNNAGKICIRDHKGKSMYTNPEEAILVGSSQAVVNAKGFEAATEFDERLAKFKGEKVAEFSYIENKLSANRDKTRQIRRLSIPLDDETLTITELLLAEAARRVCAASQNPDYEYLPNPDDKFESAKDLLDFWQKKKTGFFDDWENLTPVQKKLLERKKTKSNLIGYARLPKLHTETFAEKAKQFIDFNLSAMNLPPQNKIENVLRVLGKPAKVHERIEGYAADTYLLVPGGGVSVKSVMNAKMDIASALGVESVVIPDRLIAKDGRSFIGVDVPREKKERRFADKAPAAEEGRIPLGISNFGETMFWEFGEPSSPHLLVAGATGSGKSVLLKNLMDGADALGYEKIILDPKFEFDGITEQEEIEAVVGKLVEQMNAAYRSKKKLKKMVFIDEVSDLFANEKKTADRVEPVFAAEWTKTECEKERADCQRAADEKFKTLAQNIQLLAQKARAAGIHIVMASQRFSTKVMSGDIKANFAARVALTCSSEVDSRVMIESEEAADLVGNGDAIFVAPQLRTPTRIQCFS